MMLLRLHWWLSEQSIAHYREGHLGRAIACDWLGELTSDLLVALYRRG